MKVIHLVFVLVATAFWGQPVWSQTQQQTVLITGANRGIGLEMAKQFDSAGFVVIGTARKPDQAAELKALGVRVEALDVTSSASVAALANTLKGVKLDVLINNAGVSGHRADSFAKTDFDAIAMTFDVNSIGPMRVTQALLDNLLAGDAKTVVQISSVMGSIERNSGGYYGYRASKTALNMLNSSLAQELAGEGFTCVVLHPGWVRTRMGGAGAAIDAQTSVAGLVTVINDLTPADNGKFYDYQGASIPW